MGRIGGGCDGTAMAAVGTCVTFDASVSFETVLEGMVVSAGNGIPSANNVAGGEGGKRLNDPTVAGSCAACDSSFPCGSEPDPLACELLVTAPAVTAAEISRWVCSTHCSTRRCDEQ